MFSCGRLRDYVVSIPADGVSRGRSWVSRSVQAEQHCAMDGCHLRVEVDVPPPLHPIGISVPQDDRRRRKHKHVERGVLADVPVKQPNAAVEEAGVQEQRCAHVCVANRHVAAPSPVRVVRNEHSVPVAPGGGSGERRGADRRENAHIHLRTPGEARGYWVRVCKGPVNSERTMPSSPHIPGGTSAESAALRT